MRTKALRENRAKLYEEAQGILAKSDQSGEDSARFDAIMAEMDKLKDRIDREEKLASIGSELQARVERRADEAGVPVSVQADNEEVEKRAFARWMRVGINGLGDQDRDVMARRFTDIRADMGVGTGAGGGFLVPQAFSDAVDTAMKAFGGMLIEGDVFDTDTGADMPYPTVNDTSNVGELLSENTATSSLDVTIASTTFKAYMYSSKLIPVSLQLMQDSAFNVEQWLAGVIGERLGRILNTHFTTGTGTGQPSGIVTGSVVGKTGVNGQTTSIIYDDLVDLEHSVDPAYRLGAKFMMADTTLRTIKKLKDTTGRPLWAPGLTEKAPDTILGYGYSVNQDVAAMAASAKSVLFGAIKKYKIRRIRGVTLVRLNERYAEKLQVGFFGYARFDGRLLDAGMNPVKHYANSAV